jgi:hypothetical protein
MSAVDARWSWMVMIILMMTRVNYHTRCFDDDACDMWCVQIFDALSAVTRKKAQYKNIIIHMGAETGRINLQVGAAHGRSPLQRRGVCLPNQVTGRCGV